jgi:hypothetical protein
MWEEGQGQRRRFALLIQKKKQARDPFPVRCAQGQDDKFNNNGKGNRNRNGKKQVPLLCCGMTI